MAFDLSLLKQVPQRTQDCVFGFIRKAQKILPTNSAYYNIPSLVSYLCINYYFQREYFDRIEDGLILNESKDVVSLECDLTDFPDVLAVGKYVIDLTYDKPSTHYLYRWEFEVFNQGKDTEIEFEGKIGIIVPKAGYEQYQHWYWYEGSVEHPDGAHVYEEYGFGDKIKMEVNTMDNTLCFWLNDDTKGYCLVIDEIYRTKYHFAVRFYQSGSVRILSFEQIVI